MPVPISSCVTWWRRTSRRPRLSLSSSLWWNSTSCRRLRSQCGAMSVCTLLDKMNGSDEQLEGNLSTVLQSVRGSKQYWFFKQGEVRCMIREFGSPTLFLALSCPEYESPEIISYLRKLNTVPSSYDMGKLCTKDPISVSRKFLI